MIMSKKVAWTACLISLATPLFAASIQCKPVSNTSIQQCVSVGKNASKFYALTNMPYALCSKALCTLSKKYPGKAKCSCTLYQGKGWTSLSISPSSYKTSQPTWSKGHKLLTVQSNYSLANVAKDPNAKTIACQFKKSKPWADCFGARCKVTSANTAICLCPVKKNKSFNITGPGTTKKCYTKPNKIWSAIILKDMQGSSQFVTGVYTKFYPNSPVVKSQTK